MESGSIETILKHWTGVTVLIIFCVACIRTEFRLVGKYIGGLIMCTFLCGTGLVLKNQKKRSGKHCTSEGKKAAVHLGGTT